jgi:hypothetical protein
MAKKTQETSISDQALATGDAVMQQMEDAGLGPLRWLGTTWFEAMADLNSEVASFVADRVKEDVKTQHKILHCKNATEMREVQLDFLEKAYAQYTAETGKLIKMSLDMLPGTKSETKDTPL